MRTQAICAHGQPASVTSSDTERDTSVTHMQATFVDYSHDFADIEQRGTAQDEDERLFDLVCSCNVSAL